MQIVNICELNITFSIKPNIDLKLLNLKCFGKVADEIKDCLCL